VPRINLLPIKQARKRDTAKNELFLVVAGFGAFLVGLYFWYSAVDTEVAELAERVRLIDTDIESLRLDVARVDDFKKKQDTIQKKLEAIQRLTNQKIGPAIMLDELAAILTDKVQKVWLTSLTENEGKMKLAGGAMSPEKVSELQTALELGIHFSSVKLESMKTRREGETTYIEWEVSCVTSYKKS
jgi:type IV pilus assembly protein PilN